MPPNRQVATLTPIAAVAAGVAAQWLAKHSPGVEVPTGALEEVFLGGMAAVLTPSSLWLLGWQKHEARQGSDADRLEATFESHERALASAAAGADEPSAAFDEIDSEFAELRELAGEDFADLDGEDEGDDLLAGLADPISTESVG